MSEGTFTEIIEVDTVQYLRSKGGKPYLLFTSGEEKYFMWNMTPAAKEIPDGATCEIEYTISDKGFKEIVGIKVVSAPDAKPLPPKEAKRGDFRTPNQIIRCECLACAVELAKAKTEAGQDVGSGEVLKVAEAFENWILR